jgi:SAM-dependent methyltransferase
MSEPFAALRSKVNAALLGLGRRRFTRGHILGHGLELGALNNPFPVSPGVSVLYVDRLCVGELRHHYPELAQYKLMPVDIVDVGEHLSEVLSFSQDFVIASHVLEHCEDPMGAISNWLRVLRHGGVVLLLVPDKRFTFDRDRPITDLDHVVRDATEGPKTSRHLHYVEWVRYVEDCQNGDALARVAQLEDASYSIHFHAWDFAALRELLLHCTSRSQSRATVLKIRRNRSENLALLQKDGRGE